MVGVQATAQEWAEGVTLKMVWVRFVKKFEPLKLQVEISECFEQGRDLIRSLFRQSSPAKEKGM